MRRALGNTASLWSATFVLSREAWLMDIQRTKRGIGGHRVGTVSKFPLNSQAQTLQVKDTSGAHPFLQGRDDAPHTIVVSFHETHSPAPTLRGELLTILRVMWWETKAVLDKGHDITPVLLISVRPYQLRIIEPYYNGSKFILRYSKPVSMKITDPIKERMKAYD
ncbi:hypothetical protein ACJ73_04326 [Blastomyces percursus]|uniref:Uncharacterized protein n=1 Tax=Blastomyces percursus TaxID=1658174 RepID=A0A1J9Q6Z4_9EURO|nr:hypothetical protein ACJ73_04326 [Blastomyces percursus]